MVNKVKKEKKLRNYRAIFKDGSEIVFQAAGLKEAENAIKDHPKDPEELIELYSSPIEEERLEGPEGERCEEVPMYSKEDLDQMLGIRIDHVGDYIRIQHRILTPHLSDKQKESVEKAFHVLEEASEENASVCAYDVYIVEDEELVSMIEFTKTGKANSITNVTSFLAMARAVIAKTERMLTDCEIKSIIARLIKFSAECKDPNNFPGEDA